MRVRFPIPQPCVLQSESYTSTSLWVTEKKKEFIKVAELCEHLLCENARLQDSLQQSQTEVAALKEQLKIAQCRPAVSGDAGRGVATDSEICPPKPSRSEELDSQVATEERFVLSDTTPTDENQVMSLDVSAKDDDSDSVVILKEKLVEKPVKEEPVDVVEEEMDQETLEDELPNTSSDFNARSGQNGPFYRDYVSFTSSTNLPGPSVASSCSSMRYRCGFCQKIFRLKHESRACFLSHTNPHRSCAVSADVSTSLRSYNNLSNISGLPGNLQHLDAMRKVRLLRAQRQQLLEQQQQAIALRGTAADGVLAADNRHHSISCDICCQNFASLHNKKRHMDTVHRSLDNNAEGFNCNLCPARFNKQRTLLYHKRVRHGNVSHLSNRAS